MSTSEPTAPDIDHLPEATQKRVRFARKYVKDKTGRPWDDTGREWVTEDLWAALDGYKLWPRDPKVVCRECLGRVGSFVGKRSEAAGDHSEDEPECAGLVANKVKVIAVELDRRSGKTFNFLTFGLSEIARFKSRHAGFIASAGEQADDIVAKNLLDPIEASSYLSRLCKVRVSKSTISVPGTKSTLKWYDNSVKSVTGGGLRFLFVDEAKDVSPEVFAKICATIFEHLAYECPLGHYTSPAEGNGKCGIPGCKEELHKITGQVVIASSKGLVQNDATRDWFYDLCRSLEETPDGEYHLFSNRTGAHLNPQVEEAGTRAAISRVMGRIEGLADAIAGETEDRWVDGTQSFSSKAAISACTDKALIKSGGSMSTAFAFLDTSTSRDLTNLIVLEDDVESRRDGEKEMSRLVMSYWQSWNPRKMKQGSVNGLEVLQALEFVMTQFPGLVSVSVDLRGKVLWAEEMIRTINFGGEAGSDFEGSRPWRHRVIEYRKSGTRERDIGWETAEDMLERGLIRIPDLSILPKEWSGVRWKRRADGTRTIEDVNRNKTHREFTETLALILHRILEYKISHKESVAEAKRRLEQSPIKARLDKLFKSNISGVRSGKL